jgi:hypothetical protein
MKSLAVLFTCVCLVLPAFGAAPKVVNAADGIFSAFQNHALVGLGEWHGLAQELDFYAALVRDPRFAKEVGNVVVETGDAAQQGVVDRYVNGEKVPYTELRKIWFDTVGWYPTVQFLGSINFYAAVRAVNQTLPPESRIKVWLGEPPIDWSQVKTKADWLPFVDQRDSYPASLIEREIIGKGKKALVIYGIDHFGVYPGGIIPIGPPELVARRPPNMRDRFDKSHPGALYVVFPYLGFTTRACADQVEKQIKGILAPALILHERGTSLDGLPLKADCTALAKIPEWTPKQFNVERPNYAGLNSDAYLYLGPRNSLMLSPNVPDLYLDPDFRAEVDRRLKVRAGFGVKAIPDPSSNPATARPYFDPSGNLQ